METGTLNKIHLANMIRWDASSKKWAECADSRGIWERCCNDPTLVFSENVMKRLKNIENKNICVLGSGDNQAVFALAGLGAKVTSVDISEKQLQIAYDRARILGLEITFVQNDDVLYKSEGNFESFEFHWTISDFLNAVIVTGCKILEVDEYGENVGDWEGAPLKGLPENILIIAEK